MSNKEVILSKHHRKPKSKKGKNNHRNISMIPIQKHRAWHTLFGVRDPEDICRIINKFYLDPDYEFICQKK